MAITTAAGVLLPEVLLVGAGHATLYASVTPSGNGQPAAGRLRRMPVPGLPFARWAWRGQSRRARRRRADAVMTTVRALTRPGELTVIDDQGVRYTLDPEAMLSIIGPSEEPAGPLSVRFRLDPVPGRGIGWLELRRQDGSAIRLLPSARPAVQVSQLMPASAIPAERELLDQALADGPRHHLDIGAVLPPIGGMSVQVDSLVSRPDSWQLYLRATPRWWRYSEDGSREWSPATVDAEDDRGGMYLSTPAGGTWRPSREPGHEEQEELGYEELALRFVPRLDPHAHGLTLTFRGADEKVLVDLRL
jgi:hypothetical protein